MKYGWLVRGPDEMDPSRTVLRIYLSSVDVGAKIKACKTLSCADNALEDGAMVDFSDARHLAYAVRLNGERLQYSGGTNGEAFTLSTRLYTVTEWAEKLAAQSNQRALFLGITKQWSAFAQENCPTHTFHTRHRDQSGRNLDIFHILLGFL